MNTHTVNTSSGNLAMRSAPQVAEATWLANIPRGAGVELLSDDGQWSRINYNGQEGFVASQFLAPTPEFTQQIEAQDRVARQEAQVAAQRNHGFFPSIWSPMAGAKGTAQYRGYTLKAIDSSYVYMPIIDAQGMDEAQLIRARDDLAVLGPHPDQLRLSIAQGGARSQLNRMVMIAAAFAAGLAFTRLFKL